MVNIIPIPALSDNYIWVYQRHQQAIVIDPAVAQPVIDYLTAHHLDLVAILLTHNHQDHIGGLAEMMQHYPKIAIYGSKEVGKWVTHQVEGGDTFTLLDTPVTVIESAGHTEHHISYLIQNYLFCGDALFSGGCGRVFTGNYQAQFDAIQRIKQLPDDTLIFPAHEYTQSNLKFAQHILPNSCAVLEYQEQVDILRRQNKQTLPSTMKLEKQINPFVRATSLDEFIRLRTEKDHF